MIKKKLTIKDIENDRKKLKRMLYKKLNKKRKKQIRENKDKLYVTNNLDNIERSKSNNSFCKCCHRRIGKGTIRGNRNCNMARYKYTMRAKYCSDCTEVRLKETRDDINKLLSKLRQAKRGRKATYKNQESLRKRDEVLKKLEQDD